MLTGKSAVEIRSWFYIFTLFQLTSHHNITAPHSFYKLSLIFYLSHAFIFTLECVSFIPSSKFSKLAGRKEKSKMKIRNLLAAVCVTCGNCGSWALAAMVGTQHGFHIHRGNRSNGILFFALLWLQPQREFNFKWNEMFLHFQCHKSAAREMSGEGKIENCFTSQHVDISHFILACSASPQHIMPSGVKASGDERLIPAVAKCVVCYKHDWNITAKVHFIFWHSLLVFGSRLILQHNCDNLETCQLHCGSYLFQLMLFDELCDGIAMSSQIC